jgi:hypothetical protein
MYNMGPLVRRSAFLFWFSAAFGFACQPAAAPTQNLTLDISDIRPDLGPSDAPPYANLHDLRKLADFCEKGEPGNTLDANPCNDVVARLPGDGYKQLYFSKRACLKYGDGPSCAGYLTRAARACPDDRCAETAAVLGNHLCDHGLDNERMGRDWQSHYCYGAGMVNAQGRVKNLDVAHAQLRGACSMGDSNGCMLLWQMFRDHLSAEELASARQTKAQTTQDNNSARRQWTQEAEANQASDERERRELREAAARGIAAGAQQAVEQNAAMNATIYTSTNGIAGTAPPPVPADRGSSAGASPPGAPPLWARGQAPAAAPPSDGSCVVDPGCGARWGVWACMCCQPCKEASCVRGQPPPTTTPGHAAPACGG